MVPLCAHDSPESSHCQSNLRMEKADGPQRLVSVVPAPCARLVAATDAAKDIVGAGTGGFLHVWKDELEQREDFEAGPGGHGLTGHGPGT